MLMCNKRRVKSAKIAQLSNVYVPLFVVGMTAVQAAHKMSTCCTGSLLAIRARLDLGCGVDVMMSVVACADLPASSTFFSTGLVDFVTSPFKLSALTAVTAFTSVTTTLSSFLRSFFTGQASIFARLPATIFIFLSEWTICNLC
jgi:hypothetical protein